MVKNTDKNDETTEVVEAVETVSLTQEQLQALIDEGVKKAIAAAPAPVAPIVNIVNDKREMGEKPKFNDSETVKYLNERVPFKAFKDNNKYKDDIVIGHNGKFYQIQRGVQVMIPRFIYLLIEDSERQLTEAANFQLEMEKEYENRKKSLE